jgi:PAS domain S-box-containing protein
MPADVAGRALQRSLAGALRAAPGGRILDCNEAAVRILGYPHPEALAAAGAGSLFHDPAEWLERLERLRREGALSPAEVRLRRQDGRPVWVLLAEHLERDPSGGEVLEATFVDVSDRREMEARLLQAERLASVGTLAAGVAHEVNNPLSYVIANLGFAMEQVGIASGACRSGATPEAVDEELVSAAEALREARQGAERVRSIVRDLRMYARAEDERRAPLDVARVLDSALNVTRGEVAPRARVVRRYAAAPEVVASESRLGQVFVNLLLNAAQAMPPAEPEANEICVSIEPAPGGRVRVEIADTGTGMAPEVRDRAFEPFFTTRPAGRGTGLGLSICQTTVAALGGEIALESEPGRGTRVRVTLPGRASEPAPLRDLPSPAGLATGHRRVLVVDDDPGVGSAVRRLLRGADVQVCTDSEAAAGILRADPNFDVVLCDLFMPGTSGMDLYRELREARPELAERVVFMTAGAYTPESVAFLDAVSNPRIEKPFDAARLRALVARAAPRPGP